MFAALPSSSYNADLPEAAAIMLNSLDLPGAPAATRVVVAMSGGVDSSVVAALLKRDGYDVIGVTLQLYDQGAAAGRKGACCAGADIRDARRAAEAIGIPHYVLGLRGALPAGRDRPLRRELPAGETPIPCVDCNRSVKFRDLLETARELGADALATGHYVASRAGEGGRRELVRAADPSRDQSYFLYATTPEQLALLRFPLGDLPKEETRRLAREFGLAVADKPDSQDICFVPHGRYGDVLEKLRPDAARPGEIVHLDGRVLGRHPGIANFTVGQRRGLGVAHADPLYVLRLDPARARVIVGPREALGTRSVRLRDVNWLGSTPLSAIGPDGIPVAVKVRSTRPARAAILRPLPDGVAVELIEPEDGVSPGQACVFYEDEGTRARVLGGGTIIRQEPDAVATAA
jgi:tRNA-specific 2-thiouridylase